MRTALFSVLVFATGCLADAPDDELLGSTEQNVEAQNRISLNRISLNRISLNRISLNRISLNGIVSLETADDRDVYKYLVQCALPEGQSVTVTGSDGSTHTFDGAIGLAPSWYSGAPTASEKRWVSACLLARTNAFGISVAISLRGDNAALSVDSAETGAYGIREGAFWGDVFGETFVAYACPSPAKLANSQASTLPLRECAVSANGTTTTCGHTYAGPCASTCTDANGLYTNCAGSAEVVTTFLANE